MILHFLFVQLCATTIGGVIFTVSKGNSALAGWAAGTVYWMFMAWHFL